MEIIFLPPAKAELTDATSYYNRQGEGLGYEFAAEVKRTLERIGQYPRRLVQAVKTYPPLQDQQIPLRSYLSGGERDPTYCGSHAPQ